MSSVWNFIKRHRRKFVVLGVVVGGAVLLRRYAQNKLKEWQENETADCFDRMKREQHFASTQNTCRNTIAGLVPNVEERILALLECEATAKLLSQRPVNRIELWEDLKCSCFARLVTEVYSAALFVTLLNVQLNIIGGYMFVDAVVVSGSDVRQPQEKPRLRLTPAIQQRYLSLIQYFLSDGVAKLVLVAQQASFDVLKSVSLKEELTIGTIQEIIDALRLRVADLVASAPFRFVLPEEEHKEEESESELTHSVLLNETRDLLESDDCKKVLSMATGEGFSLVMDQLAGHFVNSTSIERSDVAFTNPNKVTIPMAKVIPIVSSLGRRLFIDLSEQLIAVMFNLDAQQVLGANIYETFSQQH